MNNLYELHDFSKGKIQSSQIECFDIYLRKLLQWNRKVNLISKKDEASIIKRHFGESISLLDVIDFPKYSTIIDIGTGAGFPGLPIKIVRSDLKMVLLDSKRLKCLFLKDVISELKLEQIKIVNGRAENLCKSEQYKHRFDFVLARAVTNLLTLYNWTNQFLKHGGKLITTKGQKIKNEIELLQNSHYQLRIDILRMTSTEVPLSKDVTVIQITV